MRVPPYSSPWKPCECISIRWPYGLGLLSTIMALQNADPTNLSHTVPTKNRNLAGGHGLPFSFILPLWPGHVDVERQIEVAFVGERCAAAIVQAGTRFSRTSAAIRIDDGNRIQKPILAVAIAA